MYLLNFKRYTTKIKLFLRFNTIRIFAVKVLVDANRFQTPFANFLHAKLCQVFNRAIDESADFPMQKIEVS